MKTRVLSAIFIAIIFIPFLYIGGIPFRVLFTILGVCGLHELIHIKDKKNKIPSIMKLVSYLATVILCLNNTMLFSYNNNNENNLQDNSLRTISNKSIDLALRKRERMKYSSKENIGEENINMNEENME